MIWIQISLLSRNGFRRKGKFIRLGYFKLKLHKWFLYSCAIHPYTLYIHLLKDLLLVSSLSLSLDEKNNNKKIIWKKGNSLNFHRMSLHVIHTRFYRKRELTWFSILLRLHTTHILIEQHAYNGIWTVFGRTCGWWSVDEKSTWRILHFIITRKNENMKTLENISMALWKWRKRKKWIFHHMKANCIEIVCIWRLFAFFFSFFNHVIFPHHCPFPQCETFHENYSCI